MGKFSSQTIARSRCQVRSVLVLALLLAGTVAIAGCSTTTKTETQTPAQTPAETPAGTSEVTPAPAPQEVTKLEIKDLKVGTGAKVKAGDTVVVHYTGWLMDGTKFDSSLDSNRPFDFVVGVSNVIQGWHDGLVGMQVGGKRQLIIPSDLAYGPQGNPPVIPPDATLRFEVELLQITPGK